MRAIWTLCFALFIAQGYSQFDHWEAAVLPENQWSYLVPNSEPASDWTAPFFDDDAWEQGPGGIGYGDGDDNTEISTTPSLYMRRVFTVQDVNEIVASSLYMDYDDAFVAYLNGVEIARSNIGTPGIPPPWDQLSDDQHEALMYDGGFPEAYDLDENSLAQLSDGVNVLSIQIHNATNESSDMSSIPFLFFAIAGEDEYYQDLPDWYDPPESLCPPGEAFWEMQFSTLNWGEEISWELVDEEMNVVVSGNNFESWGEYYFEDCIDQGCYTFNLHDSYGDGWNGAYFQMFINGELALEGTLDQGFETDFPLAVGQFCAILGCIDPTAINFDPWANTDDDSCMVFETSNLPIVVIDTWGQGIPDDPRITCHMGIIHNENGVNSINDPFNNYDGQISIELRGSTSQSFPKKPYAFETQLDDGSNNNVSIIDMPAENDWILYAPYSDKSLMRNVLTFELGRAADRYAPRTKMCELVVNGDYRGVYVLMESVKIDNNRVDIATLLPEDNEGDELTGGYLLKVDKFTGGGGEGWESNWPNQGQTGFPYIQFHRPRADDLTFQQKAYIEGYCHDFENALAGNNFDDPDIGYAAYIDVESFIDLSLINELTRNIDGYRLSTYFFKDKDSNDGKITMGPWWDYNLALGNADYCEGQWTDGWEVESECGESNPFWFERLKDDEHYANLLKCRWEKLRANEWSDIAITGKIDSIATLVDSASTRNFARWQTLGTYIWPNWYIDSQTYQDEVDYLTNWVLERIAWIDQNLEGTCIQGCMDPEACNYNEEALCEDGSCEYLTALTLAGELAPVQGELYTYTYTDTPGSSYIWTSVNGIIETGQGTSTVEVTWLGIGTGELTVQETTADGCVGPPVTIVVNTQTPIGIQSISEDGISVSPNPSNGDFSVTSLSLVRTIRILNNLGQEVYFDRTPNHLEVVLDPHISRGVYTLQVETSAGIYTKTIVIE